MFFTQVFDDVFLQVFDDVFLLDICTRAVYIMFNLTERVGADKMMRTFAADYYYFYFWYIEKVKVISAAYQAVNG